MANQRTGGTHEIELTSTGMRVRGTPLCLDPRQPAELAFVSHAHSDHLARHRKAVATEATLALAKLRGAAPDAGLPAPYRQPFILGNLQLELFPAGHILGSAQLRVTVRDRQIVYTGDLNPTPGLTAEPMEVAPCDLLVIESTFGHPRYRFPPRAETHDRMLEFAATTLAEGRTPVFFAYTLGKAQEGMRVLLDGGFPLAAHPRVAEVCAVYARFGRPLPHRVYDGTVGPGEVLFLPPSLGRHPELELPPSRTAFLTGWALDPDAVYRYGVDQAFPLSDHGDFEALLETIRATGAKKVLTVHGFDHQFAACLRDRGIDAWPLDPPRQRELF